MKPWISILALVACAVGAEPAGVGLTLSASSGIPAGLTREEWTGPDSEEFPKLDYAGTTRDGHLLLRPRLTFHSKGTRPVDYLELLRTGGPLTPDTSTSDINFSFPALDVKLVNNGKQAVHFSSAVLKVAKSAADPTPLPFLFSGYSQVQCLDFVNDGWEVIDSVQFDFTLTPAKPKGPPPAELPFHRTFQRVKERVRVSLTEELTKAGVDPQLTSAGKAYIQAEAAVDALLRKADSTSNLDENPEFQKAEKAVEELGGAMMKLSPKLAGKFEKSCWAHGRMTLGWKDGGETRTQTVAFQTDILIFPPDGLGAAGPVMGKYEAMLRESGENYELPVNLSRIVKAGGVDRFVITLGLPRTTRHELTLELKTTAGEILSSGPVSIEGLLPRSSALMLEQGVSEDP